MNAAPVAWVVEDSAALALQLRRLLETLGYQVCIAEAAQLALPLQPAPKLVCVELVGIDSNGFKLLRRIAAVHDCQRLLLTATGRNTDHNWGLRAGATAVLQRPCTLAQLAPWAPVLVDNGATK
ncbi:MAG: response regulator [Pseudomonadota bacterium]